MRTDDAMPPSAPNAVNHGRKGHGPHFVQSVARALAVLRSFSGQRPRQSLADVAKATGLDRATARRLLLTLAAFMPTLFAVLAPSGSNVPLIVGSFTFGFAVLAALSAWSARETFRVRLDDLGAKDATPVPAGDYARLRAEATAV